MLSASVRPRDPHPGARLSGLGDRMDHRLEMKRFAERRHRVAAFGNCGQEFMNFDHFQIVEAELVTRSRNELAVRRMGRSGQQCLEALFGSFTPVLVKPEFVHALLIKGDHAFGSMHLEGDVALAAPGAARGRDDPVDTVFERQQCRGDVLVFHRPALG